MNCAWATKDADLLLQAEKWGYILSRGDRRLVTEFIRWITHSPRHLQAYLSITCLDTELRGLDSGRVFNLEELLKNSRE